MRWHLGLVGHPVGHSLSPAIHEAALTAAGLAGEYALLDREEAELGAVVGELRRGERHGLNVTIPHKVAVARRVDALAGNAAALGAVNTLVRDGARVVGHNTDVGGLVRAVRDALGGDDLGGGTAVVIGAGGAGRAAVLAAFELGAAVVRVANRTRARAEALAATLAASGRVVEVASDFASAASGAALLLQASSLGMGVVSCDAAWTDAVAILAPVVAALAPDALVFDLVYRPERTVWCAAAEAAGHRAVSGLGMLVHQAADAFTLWTGHAPPRGALFTAARTALRSTAA